MTKISVKEYAGLFGPTTGDKIRLGDTGLFVEIERDLAASRRRAHVRRRQDPARRHGLGQSADAAPAARLDIVITNVTIIDAVLGVDQGRRRHPDGKIVRHRQGRQPQTMDGVTPGLTIGTRHRRDLRRAPDPHRRGHRHAHPFHLARSRRRRARQRHRPRLSAAAPARRTAPTARRHPRPVATSR